MAQEPWACQAMRRLFFEFRGKNQGKGHRIAESPVRARLRRQHRCHCRLESMGNPRRRLLPGPVVLDDGEMVISDASLMVYAIGDRRRAADAVRRFPVLEKNPKEEPPDSAGAAYRLPSADDHKESAVQSRAGPGAPSLQTWALDSMWKECRAFSQDSRPEQSPPPRGPKDQATRPGCLMVTAVAGGGTALQDLRKSS